MKLHQLRAFAAIVIFLMAVAAQSSLPVRASDTVDGSGTYDTPVHLDSIWVTTDGDWIYYCPSFVNASSKTVVAVQFQYSIVNAFNEPIQSSKADIEGAFSPGVVIQGPHSDQDMVSFGHNIRTQYCSRGQKPNGSLTGLRVTTTAVRYEDDTVWKSGMPWGNASPAPVATVSSKPLPYHAKPGDTAFWNTHREQPCDELYLITTMPDSSVDERDAYLSLHPDIKARVDACESWRTKHPA